ncbi:MAG: Asp-tRNA(Asn)/Glu-tRNA(Gln) amidotransferase subunit GatC [Patescibacteria group bacterium]
MITIEEVKKLANLARLEIKPAEGEKLRGDLNRILDYVGQIKEVKSQKAKGKVGEVVNRLREDTNPHESGKFSESLLRAAPTRKGNYFKVKKILTRES